MSADDTVDDADDGAVRTLVEFRGVVRCRRSPCGPLGLTLIGATADHAQETLQCSFVTTASAAVPDELSDAIVTREPGSMFAITSQGRTWRLPAREAFVHRDVGAAFFEAVPPATAPWSKRAFWRVALRLAKSPLARRLLLR